MKLLDEVKIFLEEKGYWVFLIDSIEDLYLNIDYYKAIYENKVIIFLYDANKHTFKITNSFIRLDIIIKDFKDIPQHLEADIEELKQDVKSLEDYIRG